MFGPYVVYEQLGRGGLSTVHRASEGVRDVALKRLHADFDTERELVEAFLREARLASELSHPHVARTLAFGKLDGTYYAACELVLGPTLRDVFRQCRSAAGAVPVGVAVELLLQLTDVLAYLHGAPRIVYRAITAENVMLSRAGRVKLIDFGIARAAGSVFDPRDDLFALGAVAHELLAGRRLDASEAMQPPSRWAPDVSRALDDIVLAALERDREQRWQTAVAMHAALTGVAKELGGRLRLAQLVREWLTWAFARKPRKDSPVVRDLIASIERAGF
jgi:serine/threonine-protein kinase